MCDLPKGVGKVERKAKSRAATGTSRTVEAIVLKILKFCILSIEPKLQDIQVGMANMCAG